MDGKTSKTSQPAGQFDDQTYAALRAFAQRAGTDQPTSIKDLPKLAAKKMKGEGARGSLHRLQGLRDLPRGADRANSTRR